MERVVIVVIVAVAVLLTIDSTNAAACTSCDIKLSLATFTTVGKKIVADKPSSLEFTVTLQNRDNTNDVTAVAAPKVNFDCDFMYTTLNVEERDYTSDTVAAATKSTLSDSTKCKVFNKAVMSDKLAANKQVILYAECTVTLKKDLCPKANFVCLDCKRPSTASYSTDADLTNNKKCRYVRHLFACDPGKMCLTGQNFETESKMCADPKANCVVALEGRDGKSGAVLFGCTTDENYCKDRKCCKVCKEDNCNTKPDNCDIPMSVASSVRASTGAILALALYQARVMLA